MSRLSDKVSKAGILNLFIFHAGNRQAQSYRIEEAHSQNPTREGATPLRGPPVEDTLCAEWWGSSVPPMAELQRPACLEAMS